MEQQQIQDQNVSAHVEAEDDDIRGGVVGPAPEKAAKALEVAQGLAEKMGMDAVATVRDEHERIVIVLEEKEGSTTVADILGGSRPPAIPSFQFLLNKIVNRFPEGRKHILVEVPAVPRRVAERKPRAAQEGAPAASPARAPAPAPAPAPTPRPQPDPDLDPTLVAVGQLLAERAKSLGKVITVHPMLAGDRRAVHQTVMSLEGVHTLSAGDGIYRRMHIVPDSLRAANGAAAGGKRRRRRRRRRGGEGRAEGAAGTERDEGGADEGAGDAGSSAE